MANQLDILIRYLLDKQAADTVEKGTNQVASDLGDVDKVAKALDKTFDDLEKKMKEATSIKEIESLERQLQDVEGEVKNVTKSYQLQARVLRSEAAAITDNFAKARLGQIKNIADQIGQISAVGLGLGLGITGGIFAGASKYVQDAKEATAVTREWQVAQESLGRSGQRIGAVFAQQALPLLKQAAEIAGQAAGFIESHPDLVRAALNFGVVVAGLGAIGTLVAKGIRIYADTQALLLGSQELAAAKLQDIAADKQLIAARLRAGIGGVEVPAGGAPATRALPLGGIGLAAIAVGGAAYAGLGNAASRFGANLFGTTPEKFWREMATYEKQAFAVWAYDVGKVFGQETADKWFRALRGAGQAAAEGVTGTIGGRAPRTESGATRVSTETLQQALKIYEDYRADDLKLVQDHYADRQKIITDSLAAEQAENSRYAAGVAKINSQTASSLVKAAEDFSQANARAEEQYNINRAKIVQDGNQAIEQIEVDSKERLRKLSRDHDERMADLTTTRDALGLAKEQRRYQDEVSEERRNTQKEVQARRAEIAQRLADLQQSYEQERAQRLADYQQRVAEIKRQAVERLAELAQQHQEELNQIRAQKAAKLRELDSQFVEERKRRYNQFLQNLRDLDAGLLGETKLRQAYQQKMLADLETFLSAYKSKASSAFASITGTTGGKPGLAFGGYAGYGTYLLGDRPGGGPGSREYVIPGDTTKMLERLIGGQITPERLMSAVIYGGSGVTKSIMYNDNRRIDSRISAADRERMRQDMMSALMEVLQ